MRPITNNEYRRIQTQTESRMAGMSLVSLHCRVGSVVAGTLIEWDELQFMCEFKISNFSSRNVQQEDKTQDWTRDLHTYFSEVVYVNTLSAIVTFPMRYTSGVGGFTVLNNKDWFGSPITFEPLTASGAASDLTTPTCMSMKLVLYNQRKAQGITDFNIIAMPYMTADSIMMELAGDASTRHAIIGPEGRRADANWPDEGWWTQPNGGGDPVWFSMDPVGQWYKDAKYAEEVKWAADGNSGALPDYISHFLGGYNGFGVQPLHTYAQVFLGNFRNENRGGVIIMYSNPGDGGKLPGTINR